MPCFLTGLSAASAAASAAGVPLYRFSHQAGHIMAAAKTCPRPEISNSDLLCFHVSGGTTELVLASPSYERGFSVTVVGGTEDISAGQLVDRTGVLLGLRFPCGGELEKLAVTSSEQKTKISAKGAYCNYSGAENIVLGMIKNGRKPEEIAHFALDFCADSLVASVSAARKEYPSLPVLFAGGVMRNNIIRQKLSSSLDNIYFGSEELSSDNAVGTAWLGKEKHERT